MATLLLAESTRLGVGHDATGAWESAVRNLLAAELPGGGWAWAQPGNNNLPAALSADSVTSTWVALALFSAMASGRLDQGTNAQVAGAVNRAAGLFRDRADPVSGLVSIGGQVSMSKTLCGLVIRELSGEDLSALASMSAIFALLAELRPDWREDPTYFVFMPWLMLNQGKRAFAVWERNGAKDPLLFGVRGRQESAWIGVGSKEDKHEAGSLGAQALADLSLSFYFRQFIVMMPAE